MLFIRSLLFHLVFYGWTLFCALALIWVFVLPRRTMVRVVTFYFRSLVPLEKYILGLTYEVRGREHLPSGACIIASKHQSAYETLKLHLLFGDPAIVLKRELMWIPLWGWYQAKTGMIPVDRGARGVAMASMLTNAKTAVEQGRKLVIFPQGTRIKAGARRPYKIGLGVLAETYQLPVVPMALNAGVFWPRHAFLIRPGKVVFEFLPAIPPGLSATEIMARVELVLEAASDRLVQEAGGPALEVVSERQ